MEQYYTSNNGDLLYIPLMERESIENESRGFGDAVLSEERDGVLLITLNRPDQRNAVDEAVARGLAAALDRLDADPSLRVGVVTGAGKGFCAGMDLKAFARGESSSTPERGFAGIVERPSEKPLIAAIEGFAVAGGLEIALACDLIVAASDARLGVPEVTRGLIAAGGALLRLPQQLPYHLAMELALLGGTIDAERAAAYGLVNRVTAPGKSVAVACALAADVAANAPLATLASKRVLVEAPGWPDGERWKRMAEIARPVRASQDAREGARAFAEKRAPLWKGR